MSHALILGVTDKVTILACEILSLSVFADQWYLHLGFSGTPNNGTPYIHTIPIPLPVQNP